MSVMWYSRGMTEMSKQVIGRDIRSARKTRGLHQKDVALALDMSEKQVGRWERGENAPGSIALSRLIQFFREKNDRDDLATLEAAVVQGIQDAIEEAGELAPDDRQRLTQVIAELAPHQRKFDLWLRHGELMIDDPA